MKIHEKLMKSPDYFFLFSFSSAVPMQRGEIKWGVERFSGKEVVVQRSGVKGGKKDQFSTLLSFKRKHEAFQISWDLLPF